MFCVAASTSRLSLPLAFLFHMDTTANNALRAVKALGLRRYTEVQCPKGQRRRLEAVQKLVAALLGDLNGVLPTPFFLSSRPVHNVPWATAGQVQWRVQISAMPGCAYGLQLTTEPPWFPVEVVVVMSVEFPTRLDHSAFCVVSVGVAMGLPTKWGPIVPLAVSVLGILCVVLVWWCSSIVLFSVCSRR